MRITVIHNPEAGDCRPTQTELLAALRAAGHRPQYQTTHAGEQVVVQEPGDVALVVGGDGTLRRVALALHGRDIPIVLLPAGTANNMAATLGLDGNLDACVRRLSAGRQIGIDVGTSHGQWGEHRFIEGCGFGVVPQLIDIIERYTTEVPHRDRAAELRRDLGVLERVVALSPAFDCELDSDGAARTARLLALEVMNIRNIGPALPVAPFADPADGLLDIVWIEEAQRGDLVAAVRAWRDRPDAHEWTALFSHVRAAHARVRCMRTLAHVDDRVWPEPGRRHDGEEPLDISFGVDAGTLPLLI